MDAANTTPLPSPTLSTPSTPVTYTSNNKSVTLVIIFVSLLIIFIAVVVAAYFLSSRYKLILVDNNKDRIQFDTFYTELPLSLDNPAIVRSSMLYSLYGKIIDVKNNNGTIQVVSDIQEQGKNQTFDIIDRTIVQIYDRTNYKQGSVDDVKAGRTMSIIGEHWNLDHKWVINYIILDTPADSTPAAGLKR